MDEFEVVNMDEFMQCIFRLFERKGLIKINHELGIIDATKLAEVSKGECIKKKKGKKKNEI